MKKPYHYAKMKLDVIEFCKINSLDFDQGNVIKYVCRYKDKNGIEDLKKAISYLVRMIKNEKKEMEEKVRGEYYREIICRRCGRYSVSLCDCGHDPLKDAENCKDFKSLESYRKEYREFHGISEADKAYIPIPDDPTDLPTSLEEYKKRREANNGNN